MDKILIPALEKLKKDSAGRSGHPGVKKAVDEALASLTQARQQGHLDNNAQPQFAALHAAMASLVPKLMVTALDCTQKLLAFKYLAHDSPETQEQVVKVISACSKQEDEHVQLQVVKALLTAVTSGATRENTLLLAVRACYHIHLVSDSVVNRTTAKLTLTQMMDHVFSSLEAETEPASAPVVAVHVPPVDKIGPIGLGMYPSVQTLLGFDSTTPRGVFRPRPFPADGSQPSADAPAAADADEGEHRKFVFSSPAHKDAFLLVRTLCKLAMKPSSFTQLTAAGEEQADPIALKTKILSLELVLDILEKAGKRFRESDVILFAVKMHLVPGLMKNCLEPNIQVTQLSVQIFTAMQRLFKEQLKKELELFFSDVFLGLLESPHAGLENRLVVLGMFAKMCGNVQQLVEIFLNYDCDWGSRDLLAQIVRGITKVAQTGLDDPSTPPPTLDVVEGNKKLRNFGVGALAALAKSLAAYTHQPAAGTAAPPTPGGSQDERPVNEAEVTIRPTNSASALATAALDSFQHKQTYRKDLEVAIQKFNEKPRLGLEYFRDRGHIDGSPASYAKFLLEHQDVLSKTMIGDYLGGPDDINIKTLHAYVELFSFKDMLIDEAVRLYLQGFRIPGEAQKIDRILEKFASRFWEENTTIFPSADTAFILSFAIIMLQTDAHNPNIKPEKKMSKAAFLKNNRGIAPGGRDLNADILGGIYDRIVAKAITLKDDDFDRQVVEEKKPAVLDAKGKRRAFFKERAEIISDAEARAKANAPSQHHDESVGAYFLVENAFAAQQHVGPMFRVVAASLQAAFTHNLEKTDDPDMATQCLEGFVNCVRVAGRFGCEEEMTSLMEALARLTKLDSPSEMRPKHVMCSQALIVIVLSEGDYLGPSWIRCLQCLSELWRLLHISPEEDKPTVKNQPTPTQTLKRVLDDSSIDRIFLRSSNLSEEAIVDFVRALVAVSRVELMLEPSNKQITLAVKRPRIFCLQKLVEVADFNMATRPRVSWGKMWEALADHFCQSGCHQSIPVAMYAVDSLKQLSLKFLDKDEFVGFAFQDRFLRPFEYIAQRSPSSDVRALVLHCIQNMVNGKSKNIKSGWEAVFDTIAASGRDTTQDNVTYAFGVLEHCTSGPPFLRAQCALKFCSCTQGDVSDKAMAMVEQFCECLFHPQPVVVEGDHEDPAKARELLKLFGAFACSDPRPGVRAKAVQTVFGLVKQGIEEAAPSPALVQRVVIDVLLPPWAKPSVGVEEEWESCTLALFGGEVLRLVTLLACGLEAPPITPEAFARVRVVNAPEDDKNEGEHVRLGPNEQWRREMSAHALGGILSQVLAMLAQLAVREQPGVAKVGVALFHYAVDLLGSHMTTSAWDTLYEALEEALEQSSSKWLLSAETRAGLGLVLPADEDELEGPRSVSMDALESESGIVLPPTGNTPTKAAPPPPPPLVLDVGVTALRAQTHLGLVKVLCRVASKHRPGQNAKHFLRACDLLENAMEAARLFNDDHALRLELARRGYVRANTQQDAPDMLEHETVAASTLLRLLDKSPDEKRFERILVGLVDRYLRQDRILAAEQTFKPKSKGENGGAEDKKSDAARELAVLTPIVLLALRGVLEFKNDDSTDAALKWLFPLLLQLIESPNRDVRAVVRRILERHVTRKLM